MDKNPIKMVKFKITQNNFYFQNAASSTETELYLILQS